MATLQEIREKYPQYDNISDGELADRMYNKFYAGKMSREEFDSKLQVRVMQKTPQQQPKGIADIPGFVANEWGKFFGETPERAAAFTDSAIDAVPVIGRPVSNAFDEVGANLRSATRQQPIEQSRGEINERELNLASKHREANIAGKIFGTTAPLAALGATNAGRSMLGETGPLWQRMAMGGASSATLTGADTATRGGSARDIATSALIGGFAGVATPAVLAGGKAVMNALMGRTPSKSATILNRAMNDDLVSPDDLAARFNDLGPDATLADLGPNLKRQGAAIAATPGKGQQVIRDALTKRSASSPQRITTQLDDTLGPVITPTQLSDDIKRAQDALSPQYEAALEGARRIDTTSIADTLDSLSVNLRGDAQRTAKKLRDMLNVVGTNQLDPNPRTVFEVRKAIDGLFDGVTDGNVRRVLGQTREQVDNLLTHSAPGIKQVDAQFEELAKQKAGFERGRSVLGGGETSPHPAELANEFAAASPSVQTRMSQGAREKIERIVGNNANDTAALNRWFKGGTDWNRSRLTTLFGEEKANKIFDIVERERVFARTANDILGNSETAARQAAQAEINPQAFQANRQGLTLLDLLAKPLNAASKATTAARSSKLNEEIAKALMGRRLDPEFMKAIANARRAAGRDLVSPALMPLLLNNNAD